MLSLINPGEADEPQNGINIGKPLLFSERSLARMLERSREALEKVDPGFEKATEGIGNVQGLRSSSRSTAVDMTFKPTLGVTETIKEIDDVDQSGVRTTSSSRERTSTRTDPSQDVVIPSITISNSNGVPGVSDSGFKLSSLDNLAERTSLFYRFINLRYLFTQSASQSIGKVPVLLGFDISIEPNSRNKHQAAEITVSLKQDAESIANNAMTASKETEIMQIFPLKETYNVISAVEDTKNIGLGVVLGPISLGARSGSNDRQMYLVQDVDTVSFQRRETDKLSFGWTFRPVLGRAWVSPGTRRVYALLAVPRYLSGKTLEFDLSAGWKNVDKSSGIMKGESVQTVGPRRSGVKLWEQNVASPLLKSWSSDDTKSQAKLPRPVGNEQVELKVFGMNLTHDLELSLAGDPVKSFWLEDYPFAVCSCGNLASHMQHSQQISFLVPQSLVKKSNYLFVGNDWGSSEVSLDQAVKLPEPSAPKAASKVEITILSEGLVEKFESLVEGSDDKEKSGSKKALLKTPKTAIAITGKGLKDGYLVVAGQVYPYASAKSKSDTSLLFEVDAKGAVGNVSFIDSSGKAHNSVTKLGTPSHKSN